MKSIIILIDDKKEKSTLSNEEKSSIRQAVLRNASNNTQLPPEVLADSLIKAFNKISLA
ncbi:hypothetical protein [Histophilus somni]|uniref:Uncharacterized protein n=1 Tax=Histophilus somni TaxID=731 RepID=A0A9Q6Z1B7_HISSO|nr:hypothetical protein [Histophilus somni]QQF66075.1 hypothetical protein JFL60_02005 [Histophilus somni]QQF70816.1 hypothetical protein JFL59_02005 [Histophilus somni]QQF72653.1 hypothetical protein JFL50_02005 [Histophilus somni]QQF76777.1 hypothetical protein JFL52_08100 [Histophilus somni]QQF79124.1 hypothetical protein JFL53_02015 [Histophilus somni]